jgi:hypothetical protein
MTLSSRSLLLSCLALAGVAAIIVACGSATDSKFDDGKPTIGTFGDGGFGEGGPGGPDLYANDPPPPWCGPDGGAPPPIGGTEACPDDKNKPGCGCDNIGDKAPCWTGLRKHRHLGVCKDGVTTCGPRDENANVWGACVGEVLPTGPTGSAACSCFSIGQWDIDNTTPCLRQDNGTYYTYSTVYDTATHKNTYCGENGASGPWSPMGVAPAGIWSTNRVRTDCAGHFRICFRIRQGDYDNPKDTDCIMGESCTEGDVPRPNAAKDTTTGQFTEPPVEFPPLPTWAGKDNQCAKQWEDPTITPPEKSPGYGEMYVQGKTLSCDAIDHPIDKDFVFHRVKFCARMCRNGANPTAEECKSCQLEGSGQF